MSQMQENRTQVICILGAIPPPPPPQKKLNIIFLNVNNE